MPWMKKQVRPALAFHASKHLERRKPPMMVIVAFVLVVLSAIALLALWYVARKA